MRHLFGAALAIGLSAHAWGADAQSTQPTVAAVPSETASVTAHAQPASAEVFKPAPMPNYETAGREIASNDEASLHPDLLRMREQHSGVLGDTSAEYGRTARVAPAGGMSLSIPVQ